MEGDELQSSLNVMIFTKLPGRPTVACTPTTTSRFLYYTAS